LGIITCPAQEAQTRVDIQLLGPEQGLPSRNTRCLAQDGRGFMWVATGQELWRYDGYTFQNFTSLLTRSIGGGTLINQMRTGPGGNIWLAHNNGISMIDPVNLHCATIDPSQNLKGTGTKQNLDIFFDNNHDTWAAIPGGKLVKISKKRVPVALYTPPANAGHLPAFESQVIRLFFDQQNNGYAFSGSAFLDVINANARFVRRINLLDNAHSSNEIVVSSIVQTDRAGLTVYYEKKGGKGSFSRKYLFESQQLGPVTPIDAPLIPEFIIQDSRGYSWYKASEHIGFLNKKTGQFTNLTSQLQQKSGA
ncbi:ligand-binding sensor domain-containing protein, partial [Dyadobacter sp.]|uniref:ligand-binding sensor domain-containing protein n=1 Tax=Dyadobacter sp. TaxID=1914288 RepID=UPI003F6EFED0